MACDQVAALNLWDMNPSLVNLAGLPELQNEILHSASIESLARRVVECARRGKPFPWDLVESDPRLKAMDPKFGDMRNVIVSQLQQVHDREWCEPPGSGDQPHRDPHSSTTSQIRGKCDEIAEMLIAKNVSYGNSVLKPIGIFAKGQAVDLLRVRIDDKLSRIANSPDAYGEDPVLDLIGYLMLLTIAQEQAAAE